MSKVLSIAHLKTTRCSGELESRPSTSNRHLLFRPAVSKVQVPTPPAFFSLSVLCFFSVCVHAVYNVHTCYGTRVEVNRQLTGVGSLQCGSRRSNSASQPWWLALILSVFSLSFPSLFLFSLLLPPPPPPSSSSPSRQNLATLLKLVSCLPRPPDKLGLQGCITMPYPKVY